jgi:hypothetical protein
LRSAPVNCPSSRATSQLAVPRTLICSRPYDRAQTDRRS